MNKYRLVSDSNYGNEYQCLHCKQYFTGCVYDYCPRCGERFEGQHKCRPHHIPAWAYKKWGEEIPYGVTLYPHKPLPTIRTTIRYQIVGHSVWQEVFMGNRIYCAKDILAYWRLHSAPTWSPWDIRYELLNKNKKVILSKLLLGNKEYENEVA